MKRKMPVIECDLCSSRQIDDGEALGLTVSKAFYDGDGGGGPVPKDTFICFDCINGTDSHGPALLYVLRILVFHDPQYDTLDLERAYAPQEDELAALRQASTDLQLLHLRDKLTQEGQS